MKNALYIFILKNFSKSQLFTMFLLVILLNSFNPTLLYCAPMEENNEVKNNIMDSSMFGVFLFATSFAFWMIFNIYGYGLNAYIPSEIVLPKDLTFLLDPAIIAPEVIALETPDASLSSLSISDNISDINSPDNKSLVQRVLDLLYFN